MRPSRRKANKPYQSAPTIHSAQLPPTPEQIWQHAHDIYFARGDVWGIIAKLRKALRIEIPIGYQDATGFHRIAERPPANQQMKDSTI